jgi:hypothetical protein
MHTYYIYLILEFFTQISVVNNYQFLDRSQERTFRCFYGAAPAYRVYYRNLLKSLIYQAIIDNCY